MHVAARKPLATCVALVGASAIALTPVTVTPALHTVTPPAISAVTTPFALTTATNPLVAFGELLGNTGDSLDATAANFLANPFPIIRQIGANQVANLAYMGDAIELFLTSVPTALEQVGQQINTIVQNIRDGNFIAAGEAMVGAVVTLFFPVASPIYAAVQIVNHTAKNIAAAAQTVADNFILTMLSLLGPFNAFVQSGGHVAQTVFDAFKEGDIGAAIGAILSAPLVQLDAVLNGFRASEFSFAPGIFTVGSNPFEDGPISAIFGLFKKIADAITPIPPVESAAVLATTTDTTDPGTVPELANLATVAVSVEDSTTEETAAPAEESVEAPAEEPAITPPVEPAEETPVVDEEEDVDATEDVTDEDPAPTVEEEDPAPVDEDAGDSGEDAGESGDDTDDAGDSGGGDSDSDGGANNDGGEA